MVEWNGGMECVLQGERSLLMQFSMKVTVGVQFLIEFVRYRSFRTLVAYKLSHSKIAAVAIF